MSKISRKVFISSSIFFYFISANIKICYYSDEWTIMSEILALYMILVYTIHLPLDPKRHIP